MMSRRITTTIRSISSKHLDRRHRRSIALAVTLSLASAYPSFATSYSQARGTHVGVGITQAFMSSNRALMSLTAYGIQNNTTWMCGTGECSIWTEMGVGRGNGRGGGAPNTGHYGYYSGLGNPSAYWEQPYPGPDAPTDNGNFNMQAVYSASAGNGTWYLYANGVWFATWAGVAWTGGADILLQGGEMNNATSPSVTAGDSAETSNTNFWQMVGGAWSQPAISS